MSYDLCEELIVEIFSRLPPKSLLRFRSVSKSLCACIDSPDFIRLRSLRSPNKNVMFIHQIRSDGENYGKKVYTFQSQGQFSNNNNNNPVPQIKLPFERFEIVGSCNGILCVIGDGNLHLWNPSIRRKLTIRGLSSWCIDYERFSNGVLGFGYDPINDDYKILRIINPTSSIYSMKTRNKREIAYPATTPYSFVKLSQCLYNGALHWVLKRYLTMANDECHCYIMKFDLSMEVFSRIELPEPNWETSGLAIIKGCLGVISSNVQHDNCRIWVRREYNDNTAVAASWSVAYTLDTNPFKWTDRVLQISPDDELLYGVHQINGITAYNLRTKKRYRLEDKSTCLIGMDVCVERLDMGTSSCEEISRSRREIQVKLCKSKF